MTNQHPYVYLVKGVYVLYEEPRRELSAATLPFPLDSPKHSIATGIIRWSDKKQNNGHSFEIQENHIINKAKEEGYDAIIMFVEKASSAYHTDAQDRPKMAELKSYILNHPYVTSMIFYDGSRVTRKITDFVLYVLVDIREKRPGFLLYSSNQKEPWDENDLSNQLTLVGANDESHKKSIRSRQLHTDSLDKSKRPPSRLPYGYQLRDDEIIQNAKANIVQLIFYLYSFGYSDKQIAEFLNEAEIQAPVAESNWYDGSIRYILNNRWYVGDLVWFSRTSRNNSKKKPLDEATLFSDYHPPAIDIDLWEITQYIRQKKSKEKMTSPFLLKGIIYCSKCNSELKCKNMTPAKSNKSYLFYQCTECRQKVSIHSVQENIINDFSNRWKSQLKDKSKNLENILTNWTKILTKHLQVLRNEKKEYEHQLNILSKDRRYYEEIQQGLQLNLQITERHMNMNRETLLKLEKINPSVANEIIERFTENLKHYTNQELRSIFSLGIKEILINFERDNTLTIDYRVTPFVNIEEVVNQAEIQ